MSLKDIPPLYTSPKIDGEGIWVSVDTPVSRDGKPLIYKTVYRPSVEFPNTVVYMAVFDMSPVPDILERLGPAWHRSGLGQEVGPHRGRGRAARGPSLNTDYRDTGKNLFGLGGNYEFLVKLTGMIDGGSDTLGGNRGTEAFTGPTTFVPVAWNPELRGWAQVKLNLWDLPSGFTFRASMHRSATAVISSSTTTTTGSPVRIRMRTFISNSSKISGPGRSWPRNALSPGSPGRTGCPSWTAG